MIFLIWLVEPNSLLLNIKNAPYQWIFPWSIFYEIVVVMLWSCGAVALLKPYENIKYKNLLLNGFKLQALTLIVPGRIGDIGLVYFLRNELKKEITTSFIITDKILTLLVTGVIASIGLAYFYEWIYGLIFLLALFSIVIFIKLLVNKNFYLGNIKASKIINQLYIEGFKNIKKILNEMLCDYKNIITNLLFTLSRAILAGISFTLILHWYGTDVSVWYVILVQALAQIVAIIPITFMGIGLVESINIHFIGSLAGVDTSIVLAASLATRAIQILFYMLITLVWLRPYYSQSK